MRRFTLYLTLVAFLLGVIAAAWIVFPFQRSAAYMLYSGGQYDEAWDRYVTLYKQGDRSLSVVFTLAQLYLEHAELRPAMALIEEYAQTHPNAHDVWEYLLGLYKGADRPYGALEALQEIEKIKPSEENLRDQLIYYQYKGLCEQEMTTLEALVSHYRPLPQEYFTLAYRYAGQERFNEALATLKKSFENCKKEEDCQESVALAIDILLKQGRAPEAAIWASLFMYKFPHSQAIVRFIPLFFSAGCYNDLTTLLGSVFPTNPYIDHAKALFWYGSNRATQAYYLLEQSGKERQLSAEELELFIQLGTHQQREAEPFFQVIRHQNLTSLSRVSWAALLFYARQEGVKVYRWLVSQIPLGIWEGNPVFQWSVALGAGLPNSHELAFYLRPDLHPLTGSEKVQLGELYVDIGLKTIAKQWLLSIDQWQQLPPDALGRLTELYISEGLAQEGLKRINRVDRKLFVRIPVFALSEILLATASGHQKLAQERFHTYAELFDRAQLEQLFFQSIEHKEGGLALHVATYLHDRWPNDKTQLMYVEALIVTGKAQVAIHLLEPMYSAEAAEEIRILYLYALLAVHESVKADVVLKELMVDPQLSVEGMKKMVGFLKEVGRKREAAFLAVELAQDAPFDAPQTQLLLELWGPTLASAPLRWIAARAHLAQNREKVRWIEYLTGLGYFEQVYNSIEAADLIDPEIVDFYMEALAQLHRSQELIPLLEKEVAAAKTVERLHALGRLAREATLLQEARRIYTAILIQFPEDKEALKELGATYFDLAAFCPAQAYLERYLELYVGDYHVYYEMGEIFYRKGEFEAAECCYLASLMRLGKVQLEDVYLRALEARLYYRLNQPCRALALYQALIEDFPNSQEVRSSFAFTLLELGCYRYAYTILFNGPFKAEAAVDIENNKTLYFAHQHQMRAAFVTSDRAIAQFPDQASVYTTRADIESRLDRWRVALDLVAKARWMEPENEDLAQSWEDIYNTQRPYLSAEWEYRVTGTQQVEHFWRLKGVKNFGIGRSLTGYVEQDDIEVTDFVRPQDGVTIPFHGRRTRGWVRWLHQTYLGDTLDVHIDAAKHTIGGGLAWSQVDLGGKSRLGFDWRNPNWDFVQTTIAFGSRDRLFVERTQFTPWGNGSLFLAANRYHMAHVNKAAAESISLQLYAERIFPQSFCWYRLLGPGATVSATYAIDAEYPTWLACRPSVDGICFHPLDITPRETHMAEVHLAKRSCLYALFQIHAGYSYDRLGMINKAAPMYGASLSWEKKPGWIWQILYDHAPSTTTSSQEVDRLFFNLTYVY